MKKVSIALALLVLMACCHCVQSADLVSIPGGTFQMGDHFDSDGGSSLEKPVHTVTVDSFCIDKCNVTNQEYCDYLNSAKSQDLITLNNGVVYQAGSGTSYPYCNTSSSNTYSQITYNGSNYIVRTKAGRSMVNDPMPVATWYGAVAYCNWLSTQQGRESCYNLSTWECDFSKDGYRLPTEAEWEYAARGGLSGKRFPWGDTISHDQANYRSKTLGFHPTWNDGIEPYTSPVGSFPANGYGLYDMAGNVYQWCNDWFGNYYGSSPTYNPTGPSSGDYRVLRGGDWWASPSLGGEIYCRTASRSFNAPNALSVWSSGFRVVSISESPEPPEIIEIEKVYINDPGISGHEGFTGWMSKYETTNAQYCKFLNAAKATGDITVIGDEIYGANGSNGGTDFVGKLYYNLAGPGESFFGATNGGASRINYSGGVFNVDSGFENHPVTYISWYGATAFCNYYGYRLPTEWEWQAVADYDGSYIYGCGTSIDSSKANYNPSTHPDGTTEVGAFSVYGYGICDMAGNVWEWTSSSRGTDYRIICGGSWSNIPGDYTKGSLEVWYRYEMNLDWAISYGDGFRVCYSESIMPNLPDPNDQPIVFPDPNTILIQNFVKQFYTDSNNPHARQGLLTYVEKAGNLNSIDSNDIFYTAPKNSSSKIVSLIPIKSSKGDVIGYDRLIKDVRPFPSDPNDPNSDAMLELSIYNSELNDLNVNSENFLKFWLPNNALKGKPVTIQLISTDPNIDYPVWDIRNIISKNNRRLPLDYLITEPNETPGDPNISVKLIEPNVPYAWFALSTNREIIDINDDGIIDLNDQKLLLSDLEKDGIFRSDIASLKNNKIILGIPDGKVNNIDHLAFVTEYNKKFPDNPIILPVNFFEGFESGQIHDPFTTPLESPWIMSSNSYDGNFCVKSGNIGNSKSSTLELTENAPYGNISFWMKVSCESCFDNLIFYIDGLEVGRWSGEQDWTEIYFQTTPGTHNFKWIYEKDLSTEQGEDAVWIDDIRIN